MRAAASVITILAITSAHAQPPETAPKPVLDEEVIEVIGRAPTSTQPIEVIDREAIKRSNASTAADAPGRVAGIHTEEQLSLSVQADNVFGVTWDRDGDGDTDLPPASLFVGLWAHL